MKGFYHFVQRSLRTLGVVLLLGILLSLATGCNLLELPSNDQTNSSVIEAPANTFKEVAAYLRQHGKLPDYYITKKEASELGWVAAEGNLHEVAPGKSIGGDRFGNREGLLPKKDGRTWYEADINYNGGTRNADRIVYSNDGLIYMTTDHYRSFTDITEGGP